MTSTVAAPGLRGRRGTLARADAVHAQYGNRRPRDLHDGGQSCRLDVGARPRGAQPPRVAVPEGVFQPTRSEVVDVIAGERQHVEARLRDTVKRARRRRKRRDVGGLGHGGVGVGYLEVPDREVRVAQQARRGRKQRRTVGALQHEVAGGEDPHGTWSGAGGG